MAVAYFLVSQGQVLSADLKHDEDNNLPSGVQ